MGVGEIVYASFTVYRRRFGPMIAIALVLVFIPFLVSLVGGCTLGEGSLMTCRSPIGWLGMVTGWIGLFAAGTAAALVAAGAYAGIPPDWRRATRVGIRRILSIVAATVVTGLIVVSGYYVTGYAAGSVDAGPADITRLVTVVAVIAVLVAGFALWTPIAVFLAV